VYCATTHKNKNIYAVLAAMPQDNVADVIRLQAYTGARVGELAAVTVGDFDRRAGTLRFNGRDEARRRRGKTGTRFVPLVADGLAFVTRLAADRQSEEPLISDLNVDVANQTMYRLRRVCALARLDDQPVPRFTSHGLRRMYAMQLLEAGVDAKTVSKITGHSVQTLLKSYVRPTQESLRKAVLRAGVGTLPSADKDNVVQLPSRAPVGGTSE
jgi:integrase